MNKKIDELRREIANHESNRVFSHQGYMPLFVADERAKILVVGQAPGLKAQERALAWGDASGERLIDWMGIDEETFRDPKKIALIPMDFYYPGKGKSGDLPPRKDFAPTWHPRLLDLMPELQLTILAGQHAQKYYLGKGYKKNLTQTVRAYKEYMPGFFPIVHPSPLNFRWLGKNPWFEEEVVPALQRAVRDALGG
ncbi:MAG: uracil-DNA glycosylase family protein [Anaerovoracaceae bacterium]|jgi:uracil-DNA glycosylase